MNAFAQQNQLAIFLTFAIVGRLTNNELQEW